MAKPIALAADHGGFELKEAVKALCYVRKLLTNEVLKPDDGLV